MPGEIELQKPTFTLPTKDRVEVLQFSPYEWSSSILAVAITNRIVIGDCQFSDDDSGENGEQFHFEVLREIHHCIRSHELNWSPQSSLSTVPKLLRFASADSDFVIRIFSTDLSTDDTTKLVKGHTSYINDVAFEPNHGEQIASVSDDHTCRVWGTLDGSSNACFSLSSPGMSVKYHLNDPSKLMVAEKEGIIRFYNLISLQPMMSLTSMAFPTMMADWNPLDSLMVGCVSESRLHIWDISGSSLPLESKQAHQNCCRHMKFSSSNSKLLATSGNHGKEVRIFHSNQTQVAFIISLKRLGGMTWHYRRPIIAIGGDRKVEFFKLEL